MEPQRLCPFAEGHDPRCAARLTIESLKDAFRFCVGDPPSCPVYQQIVAEIEAQRTGRPAAQTA